MNILVACTESWPCEGDLAASEIRRRFEDAVALGGEAVQRSIRRTHTNGGLVTLWMMRVTVEICSRQRDRTQHGQYFELCFHSIFHIRLKPHFVVPLSKAGSLELPFSLKKEYVIGMFVSVEEMKSDVM